MIELLLNRNDAMNFVRMISHRTGEYVSQREGTPDRADMRIVLQPSHIALCRSFLLRRPDVFLNPEGIMDMLPETVTE